MTKQADLLLLLVTVRQLLTALEEMQRCGLLSGIEDGIIHQNAHNEKVKRLRLQVEDLMK